MSQEQRIKNEIVHGKKIAEKGEEIWNWSSPAGQLRYQRRVAMFRDFLGNNNKQVLEVGCGTGLFTEKLALTNNKITAIDIPHALLELARSKIQKPNVIFKNEDAHRINLNDGSFDFIIGSSVLHHLEVDVALKEFFRLLKPGGKVMFTEPNMLNPQIFIQKNIPFIKKLAGDSPNETAFIRWSLERLLKDTGFDNVSIKNFDFMHPATPRFLINFVALVSNFAERAPLFKEISGSLIIKAEKSIKMFNFYG